MAFIDFNMYLLNGNNWLFICILFIMNDIFPLILSFIAGISTVIGSLFIFFKIKKVGEFIVFSLSFSLGIMILISLFDLIPSGYSVIIDNYGLIYGIIIFILIFLLGFQSVKIINDKIKDNNSSLYKIGILSLISLVFHNFPEGVAVFMGAVTNKSIGIKLCIAIMLHNIPEGIAISVPLYYSGVSRKKVFNYTLLSGLSEPIGALLAYLILRNFVNEVMLSMVLIFVSGLMISLSVNDMLKEVMKYRKFKYAICGLFSSIIVFIITLII